jgi:hypothetical protein
MYRCSESPTTWLTSPSLDTPTLTVSQATLYKSPQYSLKLQPTTAGAAIVQGAQPRPQSPTPSNSLFVLPEVKCDQDTTTCSCLVADPPTLLTPPAPQNNALNWDNQLLNYINTSTGPSHHSCRPNPCIYPAYTTFAN